VEQAAALRPYNMDPNGSYAKFRQASPPMAVHYEDITKELRKMSNHPSTTKAVKK